MSCADRGIGELIGGYELGLLSDQEKERFEEHLLECEYCFENLYKTAPIAQLIRERKLAPGQNNCLNVEGGKLPRRFFLKKWALAAAGGLALTIVAFVFVWLRAPRQEAVRLRGQDDVSILVLFPVGEVTTVSRLRWKPTAGVDSYEVRICTEAGDLIWEQNVQGTEAVLPDPIKEALVYGRTYLWQVKAKTDKGVALKSQAVRFRLRR